ncbi:MAG: HD domain-containing protein [Gammaproteobacteria bacterium]|nr:HD domain-containing protein [Gammaproteobacteria bacterium]MDH5653777.1 HD domain-containing protein [Gammaproteobacteria bacterium]
MHIHQDALVMLNRHIPLRDKLVATHNTLKESLSFIARIAVAIYDPETHLLKTFLHSSENDNPLQNYQSLLDNAPSLKAILEQGHPRVINNMNGLADGKHEHTQRIVKQGYAASYTLPLYNNNEFFGFIFFNSYTADVFNEKVLRELDIFGHLIAMLIINEMSSVNTLVAAVKTTGNITHIRDPETGSHLDRMSRYSRIISRHIADKYALNDDYIEHIFMFAPLHDIGKIGIPDDILLKPGKLSSEEMSIMRTHSGKGAAMIDDLLSNFGLHGNEHVDILRNIAAYHHEAVNGSGYPEGRKGNDIPLEARIVAVADVFDALTSKRPYKEAWDNDRAFATIQNMAGETLDLDCVNALLENRAEVEEIQHLFQEDIYG